MCAVISSDHLYLWSVIPIKCMEIDRCPHVISTSAPTFLKLWLDQINRGGIFKVNNDVSLLFQAMEVAVHRVLTISNVSANPTISVKKNTKAAILHDPASLAHWSQILSSCPAMDSSESDDLLDEISDKCSTIRGHLFAAGYIKQYQEQQTKSSSKKFEIKCICIIHTLITVTQRACPYYVYVPML